MVLDSCWILRSFWVGLVVAHCCCCCCTVDVPFWVLKKSAMCLWLCGVGTIAMGADASLGAKLAGLLLLFILDPFGVTLPLPPPHKLPFGDEDVISFSLVFSCFLNLARLFWNQTWASAHQVGAGDIEKKWGENRNRQTNTSRMLVFELMHLSLRIETTSCAWETREVTFQNGNKLIGSDNCRKQPNKHTH